MSLINDALRKARNDAARARENLSPQRPGRPRRGRGNMRLLIPVIALAASLLGGGISFLFLRSGVPSSPSPTPTIVAKAMSAEIPTERTALPETGASHNGPPEPLLPSPSPAPEAEVPHPQPTLPALQASPSAAKENTMPTPTPPQDIFTAEATIDGQHLSLDYLVFRKDNPFAQINGVTVGEGGIIDGFRLDKIEEDRIILEHGGHRYTILVFN